MEESRGGAEGKELVSVCEERERVGSETESCDDSTRWMVDERHE